MKLTGVVVAGGFVQGGFQYQIQLSGTDNRSNGHINVFSTTALPAYVQGATVEMELGTPVAPVANA